MASLTYLYVYPQTHCVPVLVADWKKPVGQGCRTVAVATIALQTIVFLECAMFVVK